MKEKNKDYIRRISSTIQTMFVFVSSDVADFIACQSALETAYGTSRIFCVNNNCFGMKFPTRRVTTSLCEYRDHSVYSDINDSILDYFFWCQSYGLCKQDFIHLELFRKRFPFKKYCPNTLYLDMINSIYQSFKSL